jgi:hypothetical protein
MNHFDLIMKKAWLILLIFGVMITILPPAKSPFSVGFLLISIVGHAIYTALVIFLLRKLATEDGLLKSKKPIMIWGYIWRAMIVFYVSLIPAVLATLIVIGVQPYPSFPIFFFTSALQWLFSIVAVWCIFSKDRKSQIRWLLSLARGY